MRSPQPGDADEVPSSPQLGPGTLESRGGFGGSEPRREGSLLALPSAWAGPAPLCLQAPPPETPLPLPTALPAALRAQGEGRLHSASSVDATPVSPAIFLLYSRGSPLPLRSKIVHRLHSQISIY